MTTRADQIKFCEMWATDTAQDSESCEMFRAIAETLRADREAAPAPLPRMPTCPICFAPELITFTEGESGHERHELMCRACETVFERAARPGVAVAPDGEEDEQPQRTLDIIARMLGWMNTPPRRVFEQEINALKARGVAVAPKEPA